MSPAQCPQWPYSTLQRMTGAVIAVHAIWKHAMMSTLALEAYCTGAIAMLLYTTINRDMLLYTNVNRDVLRRMMSGMDVRETMAE